MYCGGCSLGAPPASLVLGQIELPLLRPLEEGVPLVVPEVERGLALVLGVSHSTALRRPCDRHAPGDNSTRIGVRRCMELIITDGERECFTHYGSFPGFSPESAGLNWRQN